MPLTCIRSANAFFLQSADLFLKNTVDSLLSLPEMNSMPPNALVNLKGLLLQDPGGEQSMYWLGKILSDLKQVRSSQYARHLTGLHGKKTKLGKWLSKVKNKFATR